MSECKVMCKRENKDFLRGIEKGKKIKSDEKEKAIQILKGVIQYSEDVLSFLPEINIEVIEELYKAIEVIERM